MLEESKNRLIKKRTPSRSECETLIRKILLTEVESRTVNCTFKRPADFMKFFESLYPPSPALTKQVQRAIKSMDMARDDKGFYILNKSKEQSIQDNELRKLLSDADYQVSDFNMAESVFLRLDSQYIDFLQNKLARSITLSSYIITMIPTHNGIIMITNDANCLKELLKNISL